ncbi:hypothetical protein CVS40_2801 [Lucilia cuprina]|nr:hypothetical protein CVS40_2801 [Lucilia cuprina]
MYSLVCIKHWNNWKLDTIQTCPQITPLSLVTLNKNLLLNNISRDVVEVMRHNKPVLLSDVPIEVFQTSLHGAIIVLSDVGRGTFGSVVVLVLSIWLILDLAENNITLIEKNSFKDIYQAL